jgi:regulator of protease activity HflC (stomatin/prohibitin superfamily)
MNGFPIGLAGILGIAAVIYVARAIRIVRQFEKGLVETFGQFSRKADAGLVLLFPPFQSIRMVDMREQVMDVPPQDVITKDNASVTVDAVIYFQVTDPAKVVYNVANFALAAIKLAQTNLRNIIGELELDQTLTSRERINTTLRQVLDEATDKWGVKVVRVEIQKIEPPQDITNSMSKQMKAEREKRANILEAEGFKQAAILKAEGSKAAVVLAADGEKQSMILRAEGQAEAMKRVADAEKYKTEVVYQAIHNGNPTKDLIAIKYLETLQRMSEGPATKILLPLEISGLAGAVTAAAELMKSPANDGKKS